MSEVDTRLRAIAVKVATCTDLSEAVDAVYGALRAAVELGAEVEREACAEIADYYANKRPDEAAVAHYIRNTIRTRGRHGD